MKTYTKYHFICPKKKFGRFFFLTFFSDFFQNFRPIWATWFYMWFIFYSLFFFFFQNINSVENEDVHEISLYVQHDEFVQQVIDEQFLVQCWNGMAQGLVSYQDGHSDFTEKTLSRTMVAGSSTGGGGGNGNQYQNSNNNNQFQRRILDMVPLEPMTALPVVNTNDDHIITAGEDQVNMIEIVDSQKSRQNNNHNNDRQMLHKGSNHLLL